MFNVLFSDLIGNCFEKYVFFHFFWQTLKILLQETSDKPQMIRGSESKTTLMYLQNLTEKNISFSTKPKESIKKLVIRVKFFPHAWVCVVESCLWWAALCEELARALKWCYLHLSLWETPGKSFQSLKTMFFVTLQSVFYHNSDLLAQRMYSSAAQDALKKVKESATKYLLLFPRLALTTTFRAFLNCNTVCTIPSAPSRKVSQTPSPQPKTCPSLHHTWAVTCSPAAVLLFCPLNHAFQLSTPSSSQERKPLIGWTEIWEKI